MFTLHHGLALLPPPAGTGDEDRILVVTQDESLLEKVRSAAVRGRWTLLSARSEVEAIVQAHDGRPTRILIDPRIEIDAEVDLFPSGIPREWLCKRGRTPHPDDVLRRLPAGGAPFAPQGPARLLLFAVPIAAVTLLAIAELGGAGGGALLAPKATFWAAMLALCGGLGRIASPKVQREGLLFAHLALLIAAAPSVGLRLIA
ncbi:MAG: hypothetical protein HY608_02800 [Planctomycetes bacterium]|nr:hypothetical protein [Planctomycetota bacterium]